MRDTFKSGTLAAIHAGFGFLKAPEARRVVLAGLLFLLSGAAALVYQVAWQRILALHSGVGLYSVTMIVAAFGTSIFAMTAFDFDESMVGSYGEIVMAVIVAPIVKPGERLPKSAMYPYQVAVTTKAPRDHAIERWHLPHWMEDVDIQFVGEKGRMTAKVRSGADPIAELSISDIPGRRCPISTSPS